MTLPRGLRIAGAIAAVALAAAIAFVAEDARQWPQRLEAGDTAFAASPAGRDAWQTPTGLPARIARNVLGVDDDLAYRRALQLYEREQAAWARQSTDWVRLVARSEAALADAERSGDGARRSSASNLLGIVYFDAARATSARSNDFLRSSIAAYQRAVMADPDNADAKHNLELLLSRLVSERDQGSGRRNSRGGGQLGGDNAGLQPPGTGY
jgi:hypothetical protein